MSICEDRITEDSTEFEKEFSKIYDGNLWTALDKMKDWQPPKPLAVVPEITQKQADTFIGGIAMKDPEIELKRRLHNLQTGQNLTYEDFCLYEIKNLNNADKISAKEFKSTIGIERNVKKQIMRKL